VSLREGPPDKALTCAPAKKLRGGGGKSDAVLLYFLSEKEKKKKREEGERTHPVISSQMLSA